jgi:modification methylase
MQTHHRIDFRNAKKMIGLADQSVALVVTSPPYPMIAMWDDLFVNTNKDIAKTLGAGNGMKAFELMHLELDPVWRELWRVLVPGGIACINIGDATRTINGDFILYPNHARILSEMVKIGFTPLPEILWRKQTNAPNKFMGSGMMPPGAYVTLEHEHILILRKGSKREFRSDTEKSNRKESAFFWEERNLWFSDVWMDLKGTVQKLKNNDARLRSAAYPFEVPYRLINMFSVKGDLVLDPFMGTGVTTAAAIAAARNSVGFELSNEFLPVIDDRLDAIVSFSNERIQSRLHAHLEFITERIEKKGPMAHFNEVYGFPVVTNQETDLLINPLTTFQKTAEAIFEATYQDIPNLEFDQVWEAAGTPKKLGRPPGKKNTIRKDPLKPVQRKLLDF